MRKTIPSPITAILFSSLFSLLVLCLPFSSSAESTAISPDSLAKLHKKDFLSQFGKDDTAKAIIKLFYHRRSIFYKSHYGNEAMMVVLEDYSKTRMLPVKYKRPLMLHYLFKKSEFRITRDSFLDAYGKDDSMKALINIFYTDRNIGYATLWSYPVAVLLPAAFIAKPVAYDIFIGSSISRFGTADLVTLSSVYLILNYNRHKLRYLVWNYQRTGYLPPNYRERVNLKVQRQKRKREKLEQKLKEYQEYQQKNGGDL